MREHEYKIWYPDSKIMKGPYSIDLFFIKNSVHPEFTSSENHIYLEYTGLKCQHGKKIYEGDIIKYHLFMLPVIYDFERGLFRVRDNLKTLDTWLDIGYIIGNIYQNPELLEK